MITSKWTSGLQDMEDVLLVRRESGLGEETDALDEYARQLVLYESDRPAAAGRIVCGSKGFAIGKICSLPQFRGQHITDLLTRVLIWQAMHYTETLRAEAPGEAAGYFARYGFTPIPGEEDMQVTRQQVRMPSVCGGDAADAMVRGMECHHD